MFVFGYFLVVFFKGFFLCDVCVGFVLIGLCYFKLSGKFKVVSDVFCDDG